MFNIKIFIWIFATTSKICTSGNFTQACTQFYFNLRWVYVKWKSDIGLSQVSLEPATLSYKV